MVAELGDKIIVNDIMKYVDNRKTVNCIRAWARNKPVDFVFMPFQCLKDGSEAFLAVEFDKIKDFQKLCHEVPADPNDWGGLQSYEFTVTKDFKYGQNLVNIQTGELYRFLIFLDPSHDPFQDGFIKASGDERAIETSSFIKNLIGVPLRTF
ncbi:hypothetical protein BGZ98_009430 [Dissophora globulifera]|nr:hypothetical protein BGZ98_009430 [Dissophora globulifera]